MKWGHWIVLFICVILFRLITGTIDRINGNSEKWECAADGGTIIPKSALSPPPRTDVCLKKEGGT